MKVYQTIGIIAMTGGFAIGETGIGGGVNQVPSGVGKDGSASAVVANAAEASGIVLTQPAVAKTVIQRRADQKADIAIAGKCTGKPEKIEARVVALGGVRRGFTVASGRDLDWQTVAERPSHGQFSGALRDVAAGGWYRLEVRQIEGGVVTANTSLQELGVGDVFVTAGQSNSANHGGPCATPVDNRGVALKDLKHESWVLAADPQPIASGKGGSVWSRFVDLWAQAENVPVALVNLGVGSTETSMWLPSAVHYPRLRTAMKRFPRQGIRAVLWHQGESDSIANVSASGYQANLKAIIEATRADAGWEVPWYVAQASFHPKTGLKQEMPVAAGQRALAWSMPKVDLGPRTDDFHQEGKVKDGVHFNAVGLADHANQWVRVLHRSGEVVLQNTSFQTTGLADGAQFSVDVNRMDSPSIPGWQALSADGEQVADAVVGYYNPSRSQYTMADDQAAGGGVVAGMDGTQCGFLYEGSAGCQLLQTMPVWIQADTEYTLTVAIGHRLSGRFAKARIELLGGGEVLNACEVTEAEVSADSFKDIRLSYRSPKLENNPKSLAIRIVKVDGGAESYLDVDHVRLVAKPVGGR